MDPLISIKLDHNELIDPVSYQQFDSDQNAPVSLPCGHTFSKTTLKNLIQKNQLKCPQCKKEFPRNIPLEKNLILASIAQKIKEEGLYRCHNHPTSKATFMDLTQNIFLCKYCIIDKKYASDDKVILEDYMAGIEDSAKKLQNINQNIEKVVEEEKALAEEKIQNAIKSLGDMMATVFESDLLITKLIEWGETSRNYLAKLNKVRSGEEKLDFGVTELEKLRTDFEVLRESYRKSIDEEINDMFQQFVAVIAKKKESLNQNPHKPNPEPLQEEEKKESSPTIKGKGNNLRASEANIKQPEEHKTNISVSQNIHKEPTSILTHFIRGDKEIAEIPEFNTTKLSLVFKGVSNNGLGLLGLKRPEEVEELSLNFSESPTISDEAGPLLSELLKNFEKLKKLHLELQGTKITDEAMWQILPTLNEIPTLKDILLNLEKTSISKGQKEMYSAFLKENMNNITVI